MVKINTELVEDMLRFQAVYEAYIDFDATYEELGKLGYCPKRHRAGRKPQVDAGNLTFTLKSGAKVNVFPKGQPHKIQVSWNIREEKEKQFCELTSVLVPSEGERLIIVPVLSVTDDRDAFLDYLFNEGLI